MAITDNLDALLKTTIYAKETIAAKKATAEAAYEARVVKKIMTGLGLEGRIAELGGRVKELTGYGKLTLSMFHEMFPSFPIYLVARKIPFAFKVTPAQLFSKPFSTPILQAWEEANDEKPDFKNTGMPVGVVFDWPGVKGTQMLVHDALPATGLVGGVQLVIHGNSGETNLVIERLDPMLQYIREVSVF